MTGRRICSTKRTSTASNEANERSLLLSKDAQPVHGEARTETQNSWRALSQTDHQHGQAIREDRAEYFPGESTFSHTVS